MDHIIDGLPEGVIEKEQFTARMNRTKTRIADIDATIAAQISVEGRQAHLRSVRSRLTETSSHVQNQLNDTDWTTKREIIPYFSGSDWASENRYSSSTDRH
jgi:site-specific DNA recombinase